MLQLGARYYWPEVGRFVSHDPIREGINWYAYVGGNPVVRADPDGEHWYDPLHWFHPKPDPKPKPKPEPKPGGGQCTIGPGDPEQQCKWILDDWHQVSVPGKGVNCRCEYKCVHNGRVVKTSSMQGGLPTGSCWEFCKGMQPFPRGPDPTQMTRPGYHGS